MTLTHQTPAQQTAHALLRQNFNGTIANKDKVTAAQKKALFLEIKNRDAPQEQENLIIEHLTQLAYNWNFFYRTIGINLPNTLKKSVASLVYKKGLNLTEANCVSELKRLCNKYLVTYPNHCNQSVIDALSIARFMENQRSGYSNVFTEYFADIISESKKDNSKKDSLFFADNCNNTQSNTKTHDNTYTFDEHKDHEHKDNENTVNENDADKTRHNTNNPSASYKLSDRAKISCDKLSNKKNSKDKNNAASNTEIKDSEKITIKPSVTSSLNFNNIRVDYKGTKLQSNNGKKHHIKNYVTLSLKLLLNNCKDKQQFEKYKKCVLSFLKHAQTYQHQFISIAKKVEDEQQQIKTNAYRIMDILTTTAELFHDITYSIKQEMNIDNFGFHTLGNSCAIKTTDAITLTYNNNQSITMNNHEFDYCKDLNLIITQEQNNQYSISIAHDLLRHPSNGTYEIPDDMQLIKASCLNNLNKKHKELTLKITKLENLLKDQSKIKEFNNLESHEEIKLESIKSALLKYKTILRFMKKFQESLLTLIYNPDDNSSYHTFFKYSVEQISSFFKAHAHKMNGLFTTNQIEELNFINNLETTKEELLNNMHHEYIYLDFMLHLDRLLNSSKTTLDTLIKNMYTLKSKQMLNILVDDLNNIYGESGIDYSDNTCFDHLIFLFDDILNLTIHKDKSKTTQLATSISDLITAINKVEFQSNKILHTLQTNTIESTVAPAQWQSKLHDIVHNQFKYDNPKEKSILVKNNGLENTKITEYIKQREKVIVNHIDIMDIINEIKINITKMYLDETFHEISLSSLTNLPKLLQESHYT